MNQSFPLYRPTLPPSKQANPALLKKAMQAAQVSTDSGEYNPEVPSSTELPEISDAETKRRKREQLMLEHKKLQRLKSQQEEEEETTVIIYLAFRAYKAGYQPPELQRV